METVLRLRFGYGQIVPWVRRDKAAGVVPPSDPRVVSTVRTI